MQLKDLYKKDINRPIQGVIKVDDERSMAQELSEYVVTSEILTHLDTFFEAYSKSLGTSRTEQMGVWLSGFFGSGKSHFLKIVSYLLDNREVEGKKAVDYFDDKINDAMLLGNIKRAGDVSSDIILFNIDVKSEQTDSNKDNILTVFNKVFNEKLGYSSIGFVADIERHLHENGKYEEFKSKFNNWPLTRAGFILNQPEIASKYAETMNISPEEAANMFDRTQSGYQISVESFAQRVQEYIEKRGNDHHVVFLIDEVGQYIGNNGSLLLNLQSIVEELGVRTNGRAWVVCSSQQAIDDVVTGVKKDDFSKILGRFDTKIVLSSTDIDEVIRQRLLAKTEDGATSLASTYNTHQAEIANLLTFGEGGTYKATYRNAQDFASTYPYIPYQFKLIQEVFMSLRRQGHAGTHLSSGARSLLGAIQETAKKRTEDQVGTLVPFYDFYETVVTSINSSFIRTFDQVKEMIRHGELEPQDEQILKTLFMLRGSQETMPTNLDNLAVLSVSSMSDNILDIKNKLAASLKRLEDRVLVQKLGENYRFLTDDEQDVNREIKNQNFDTNDRTSMLGEIIRGTIDYKYKYSNDRIFSLDLLMDDYKINGGTNELALKFTSDDIQSVKSESIRFNNTAFVITPLSIDFKNEMDTAIQIEKYIKGQSGVKNDPERDKIITARRSEMEDLKEKIAEDFKDIIRSASVVINGTEVSIPARENVTARRDLILEELVKSVYTKIEYIQKPQNRSDIKRLLTLPKMELEVATVNTKAEDAINEYIIEQDRNHIPVTLESIVRDFKAAPFGFTDEDVAYIVAHLLKTELVSLIYNGTTLPSTADTADILLKSANDGRITIKVRERIDNQLLDTVRDLARDLFDTTALGDTEDDMAENLRREIDAKLEATTAYLQKYNYQAYPGKLVVEGVNAALRELKQIRDTKDLFDSFSTKQSDLRTMFDAYKPVVSFFEHQIDIFDRAAKAVKDYDFVSSSITVNSPEVTQIRDILTLQVPYNDIPRLSPLATAVEQAVSAGHKTLNEKQEKARQLEEQRRQADAERAKAEAEGREPIELPKVAKPVRSGDLINRTYSLKNEADVDSMLSDLRQRLLQELTENGEVEVI